MATSFKKEADLAEVLVGHLKQDGWDVFEEVRPCQGGARADIVAVKGGVIRVIECKLAMSFSLLNQARHWVGRADEIYVAVPRNRKHWKKRQVADLAIKMTHETLGIGVIEVQVYTRPPQTFVDFKPPKEWPKVAPRFKKQWDPVLTPEVQEFAAKAGESGKFWTPFKGTCKQLLDLVLEHPEGVSLKDAVNQINHHYAHDKSAVGCLSTLAKQSVIPGLALEKRGRTPYLVPKKEKMDERKSKEDA